ncbi:MAG: hypothetical protein ABIR70_14050 [Bryobacteraceae bacterium]
MSQLLEPTERQSVLGDIEERGPSFRDLLDLIGLVARRQFQTFTSWKMWLAAITLSLPVLAITNSSRAIADTLSYYPWPDLSQLSRPEFAWMIAESALATLALTWSTGYALATIARHRSLAVTALLALGPIAYLCMPLLQTTAPHHSSTSIRTLAFMLWAVTPGLLGMRRGWLGAPLTRRNALILAAACVPFAFLLPNSPYWSGRILSVLAFWPAYYAMGFSIKGAPSHA